MAEASQASALAPLRSSAGPETPRRKASPSAKFWTKGNNATYSPAGNEQCGQNQCRSACGARQLVQTGTASRPRTDASISSVHGSDRQEAATRRTAMKSAAPNAVPSAALATNASETVSRSMIMPSATGILATARAGPFRPGTWPTGAAATPPVRGASYQGRRPGPASSGLRGRGPGRARASHGA